MSAIATFADDHEVLSRRICFAPFVKGGYGGFALALRVIEEQEQIPLGTPFSKGEKKLLRWVASFPRVDESFMRVAA